MQKSIRTWLNMADCVRRMARWKSFYRTQRVTAGARDATEPRALPTAGVSQIHVCGMNGEERLLSPHGGAERGLRAQVRGHDLSAVPRSVVSREGTWAWRGWLLGTKQPSRCLLTFLQKGPCLDTQQGFS